VNNNASSYSGPSPRA